MLFTKTKTPCLTGPGKDVVYKSSDGKFYIKSGRLGLTLDGRLEFSTHEDLEKFASLISDAWKDYLARKPTVSPRQQGETNEKIKTKLKEQQNATTTTSKSGTTAGV